MTKKIRVGAVSYFNTKPLIYGFEHGMMKDKIELVLDYPSKIASALLNDEIDIGLVPVITIPKLKQPYIISDYGIASDGPVATVCLFSQVPVDQINTVLLDYQSNTSVVLVKILLKEFWKINPVFINASADFLQEINGTTAAVVIGDRAFEQHEKSAFVYDLGAAWKEMTGLPFIFAAWISNKPIEQDFINEFNEANLFGLNHIDELLQHISCHSFDLKSYYTDFIHYRLNAQKRKGLNLFLEKVAANAF